ncbi:hypothetical protein GF1_17260 [Desulfolithobacter dissulfuricans]|uniref:Alcohol dehydrogenase iron-type/glycerol dehydrogenase GldA domain-containing protein n=1 Tax=Desulfolithobacter dissulfuricans TaxID=2795293 RepID=A0A915UAB2_9BACT|nr:hypothetical protein GF1_17260 [Desulfolithobacter dissulfuricans]
MQNFVFHNPTKILFGRGTIGSIGPETRELGSTCLLVYGKGSIKKNGVYQQVYESLDQAGIRIVEHHGVRSNPVLSHVREGIDLARKHGVDVVVAAGAARSWTRPRPSPPVPWLSMMCGSSSPGKKASATRCPWPRC